MKISRRFTPRNDKTGFTPLEIERKRKRSRSLTGFTMIELMITVIIVAVCLVFALRVFSVCAAAVSRAYNDILAVDILEEKIDKLKEKAITEDGISSASTSEEIVINGRKFIFIKEIEKWKPENGNSDSESEPEQAVSSGEGTPAELQESETNLRMVNTAVRWNYAQSSGQVEAHILIPAKGYRHEF